MIEYECPHCGRSLRVSEKFIGEEGACKYCGGRVVIAAETPAPPPPEDAAPERKDEAPDDVSHDRQLSPSQAEEAAFAYLQREMLNALKSNIEVLQTQLNQSRSDIERLARDLEVERVARIEAEVSRDVAEIRARRLEENLASGRGSDDVGSARADLDRAEAQLAQSRLDLEHLAQDLETERAVRVRAEAAQKMMAARFRRTMEEMRARAAEKEDSPVPDMETILPTESEIEQAIALNSFALPEAPQETEVPELAGNDSPPTKTSAGPRGRFRGRPLLVAGSIGAVFLFLAASFVWLPPMRSVRAHLFGQAGEGTPEAPPTGSLTIHVSYVVRTGDPKVAAVPAPNVTMLLARQRFDSETFDQLLQEAGVPREQWAGFGEWYYVGEPDTPEAKQFLSTDDLKNAPFAEPRKQTAALADRLGRTVFATRLAAAMVFDAPPEWTEYVSTNEGVIEIASLAPGRYLVLERPDGPQDKWAPVDPKTAPFDRMVLVRKDEHATTARVLTDTVSAIRGTLLDAETTKPMGKIPLVLSGEAVGGKKITVTTQGDGSFSVKPSDIGYGAFTIQCDALPKGYLNSTSFSGVREVGAARPPIVIQLSKKNLPKQGKKSTVSGRVLNSDGSPAPGFGLWMLGEDGSAKSVARSDRDGTFEFDHEGGSLRLYAAGPGSARTETVTLDLQPSQSTTRDFVLPLSGRIVLTITTPDGQTPESFEECMLVTPSRVSSDPAMMRKDGARFAIPYLVQGVYDLSFKVKGFKPISLPGIAIEKDSDRELTVNLEPAG